MSLLDQPLGDVEAARGEAVGRVRVVVDDPDSHGGWVPLPYRLRLEMDSVASTAPRTRSMRMGLSCRSAATSVSLCLTAITTASKCRSRGSSRTSARSSGNAVVRELPRDRHRSEEHTSELQS